MKGSKVLLAALAFVIVGATSAVAQQDTTKKAPPAKVAPAKVAPAKAAPAPTFSEADIKAAQVGLAKGKFYTGTPSGKVDAATRKAIRAYQTANKLKVTGVLSDSLITALKAAQ